MPEGKVCIFDSSSLVYIYLHSRRCDAHGLLQKYKKELNSQYVLAKNDLHKDLILPLQTKFKARINVLFNFQESPRDERFNEIQTIALENHYITQDDVRDSKLTDLDIVRLAIDYQEQGEEVIIITDDEGVHKLAKELNLDADIDVLYSHLYFMQILPHITDKNDRLRMRYNVEDSFYYLYNYLKQSNRHLPYEKVINTSINILSRSYSGSYKKKFAIVKESIDEFLASGKVKSDITDYVPILEIVRKNRLDPDYSTELACLQLMTRMSDLATVSDENKQLIFDLAHREFASYHLELANSNHSELNLVGSLGHIRSAAQAMAFIDSEGKQIEKSLEEILFIEALLLLELGSEQEAFTYFQEFLDSNILSSSDAKVFRNVAESLLVIFDKKVGRIKATSEDMLLELVKEAIAIPNPALAKTILIKMIEDESVNIKYRKAAAEEIYHLANIRLLLADNPIIEKAEKLLGKKLSDRTSTRPDSVNLEKVKNDLSCKEAEAYLGPWELAEIRTKKKSTWV
ncbi:MAG: hypothetical protein ACTSQN_18460, partial [Candidatus Heimdallarchaeota archaeon]